ncbi:hypothetical protein [Kribbella monticola]|uniref:hypothetical protein n=1 Tax=Kribbella monticola TaxID=2185285 RepID=UPI000DD3AD00|nr:hypothetical protein [Kribbella monticola]
MFDGVAFLPPSTELHMGFSESQVRSVHGPILSAVPDLSYAVAGLVYHELSSALGKAHPAIAALVSVVATWQCIHDLATTDWGKASGVLYQCIVSNYDDIKNLIIDVGAHIPAFDAGSWALLRLAPVACFWRSSRSR